ncbi:hypothetical protein D8674_016846 [Pyrus ussuriensis x Pyrus communis]|uniref:Fungal lipase-like domain-containing protein n=1 Tax=Pyrus ussuriensis x Pyrus communis TaxID=2448454 RepID=A0A5N5HAY9_9ROSA|nr:hypothetical protein D8674_016846 [Pyrus ussuriensis x Pyrus communis]
MATAAGAAVILYYVLNRRVATNEGGVEDGDDDGDLSGNLSRMRSARKRLSRRPAQAPATWVESLTTLSDTLRFTYSETLGKWPIGDLAFGINYLMRRQGNLQVASVYAGSGSVQLKGSEIVEELKYYLKLLTLCMLFSKKPFPVFLESGGFSQEDVLLQKPKAGAVGEYPDYKVKVIGHSLGGGTAALLTYILREQKEFSSSTCITFAPEFGVWVVYLCPDQSLHARASSPPTSSSVFQQLCYLLAIFIHLTDRLQAMQ